MGYLTDDDVKARIDEEGIGYTLLGYYGADDLEDMVGDPQFRQLVLAAQRALQALQEYIDAPEDSWVVGGEKE